jgi:exopolysaccharide biosynthesis predicted pyruvyltransferase EpsI
LLDPTLLLDKNDYIQLVEHDSEHVHRSNGNLFVYILDRTTEKQQTVNRIASDLHLTPFEIMPESISTSHDFGESDKHIYPPITQWLQSFMDAEFIITDSFHGTVFSILFNKPFVTIGNSERGMTRFSSLLKVLDLEKRLISSCNELNNEIISDKMDWNNINRTISGKREEAIRFLADNLK